MNSIPRSRVARHVLLFFFTNENSSVYVNELARILKEDPKNVYRALLAAEKIGIITSSFKGRERFFSAHKKGGIYQHYKSLFLKTAGIEAFLAETLRQLAGVKEAYIFGSYAQDPHGQYNDIDILLVGEHDALAAQKLLYRVQERIRHQIHAVNMTEVELRRKRNANDQFVNNLFSKKTIRII